MNDNGELLADFCIINPRSQTGVFPDPWESASHSLVVRKIICYKFLKLCRIMKKGAGRLHSSITRSREDYEGVLGNFLPSKGSLAPKSLRTAVNNHLAMYTVRGGAHSFRHYEVDALSSGVGNRYAALIKEERTPRTGGRLKVKGSDHITRLESTKQNDQE